MNDIITLRGFVATEPKSSTTPGGTPTATFRLGSTERKLDRAGNVWVDGNTNWFSVQAFRHLAGNIGCSIKKGQRVIVVGKLRLRQWEHEGKIYHSADIDAVAVGHDLMWGSANFIRMASGASPQNTTTAVEAESSWPAAEEAGRPRDEDEPQDDHLHDEDGTYGGEDGRDAGDRGAMLPAGEGDEPVLVDTGTGELVGADA